MSSFSSTPAYVCANLSLLEFMVMSHVIKWKWYKGVLGEQDPCSPVQFNFSLGTKEDKALKLSRSENSILTRMCVDDAL